jgi:hypothetical protein
MIVEVFDQAYRWHIAHFPGCGEYGVIHTCGCTGRILRIKRKYENLVAARGAQFIHDALYRRRAVTHCPGDSVRALDAITEIAPEQQRLFFSEYAQRRPLAGPNRSIFFG